MHAGTAGAVTNGGLESYGRNMTTRLLTLRDVTAMTRCPALGCLLMAESKFPKPTRIDSGAA